MSADIISIDKTPIVTSDAKAEFIQAISSSFDNYVLKTGEAPHALIYIYGGAGQPTSTSWHMREQSQGLADEVLCRASAHLIREVTK